MRPGRHGAGPHEHARKAEAALWRRCRIAHRDRRGRRRDRHAGVALGNRMNALIVDDEPLAREGMALLLKDEPSITSLAEARNGAEAVEMIRETRPDLVLLDVQMPEMDGFGVLRAVGVEEMPPFIFVTAHD